MKYTLFLSDFNETWIFLTFFRKIVKYQVPWKSVQWKKSCSMRTDGHEVKITFSNFANAPDVKHRVSSDKCSVTYIYLCFSLFMLVRTCSNHHAISLCRLLVACLRWRIIRTGFEPVLIWYIFRHVIYSDKLQVYQTFTVYAWLILQVKLNFSPYLPRSVKLEIAGKTWCAGLVYCEKVICSEECHLMMVTVIKCTQLLWKFF